MFSNHWIDIQADDKPFFAIIYPISGNKHPVVICTWTGTGYSFYGLVHELGHACNHFLSKKQGELNDNTSLAYSEIASIFFENLAFNFLLRKENDKQKRLCIIVDYLQYLMYYLCFLMADHCFELRTYEERKSGELTEERLREIWLEEQRAACGEYVEYNDAKGNDWLSQFRFFVQPFSCYGYAFAECIVYNLYQVYRNKSVPDFEDKFLTFLSETGIKDYKELLVPFGLDPTKEEFWQRGVNIVVEYIDEAERLAEDLIRNA
jgi:oligoendopeptidase F